MFHDRGHSSIHDQPHDEMRSEWMHDAHQDEAPIEGGESHDNDEKIRHVHQKEPLKKWATQTRTTGTMSAHTGFSKGGSDHQTGGSDHQTGGSDQRARRGRRS